MDTIENLIGNTPLLRITKNIFAKMEMQNPGGSIKDRAALAILNSAEKSGELQKNAKIIEATSGNFGISLAMLAAIRKYRLKIFLPENVSLERRKILQFFGVEIEITTNLSEAIKNVQKLNTIGKFFWPNQFENPANIDAHRKTTANEIWQQTNGKLDFFLTGVGSGGTISGCAETLKNCQKKIKVIAIEPAESPVLQGGVAGKHKIQGIGAPFVPRNFKRELVDEIWSISEDEASENSKILSQKFGILAGISSGANFAATKKLAKKNPTAKIITIFSDSLERYLS
jgi:cysteine synthase